MLSELGVLVDFDDSGDAGEHVAGEAVVLAEGGVEVLDVQSLFLEDPLLGVLLFYCLLLGVLHVVELGLQNLALIGQLVSHLVFLVELEDALRHLLLLLTPALHDLRVEAHALILLHGLVVSFHQRNNVDEVGVVGVDVPKFNFDEVFDHFLGFVEGSQEEVLHDFENLFGEVVVALDLGDFYGVDEAAEFFVDEMGAFQGGQSQPEDLGFQ